MKQRLTALLLAGFLILPSSVVAGAPQESKAPAQQPQEQRPKDLKQKQEAPRGKTAIRVSVEQVSVDVTVTDKNGNLIRGLAPENFKLYEDKVEQQITNFSPVDAPITVVLLVEYNNVVYYALYEI